MNKEKQSIAVVGAGIGGLSAAYDLAMAGNKVVIFEASDHVGGLAAGFKEPHWDWTVERFYHHWFHSDEHMLGLIDELGWSDQVIFPKPTTVMYYRGKFYPFDSITAALMYPGLGWGINKIRFGLIGLYLRLTNNWQALEKTTVDTWMRKWAGDKVYESMWEPMMIGKFGEGYARVVNMAWFWARLHARTTRLGTFEGGFQVFADKFAERLEQIGVEIRLESHVTEIKAADNNGILITTAEGQTDNFSQTLVTTSPGLLARLAPDLPKTYLDGLLSLNSMGAVVMVVSLKHQLSREGYYWYNIPKAAGFPFLSLVEHTNFVKSEYFGGDHILYIGDYLPQDHAYFDLSKSELEEKFLPHLKKFNPDFSPDWVNKTWLYRTKYAQPVPLVNHSQTIPAIRTPIEGLYFASMSQVYPWDRGTNFAVEIGRRAANMMIQDKND
ncbi:MAG: NAD(P)/FAD-dependent oxidoreductase [Brevefilum sp.]|nr:NAD(P)/FAD-dependent oxidoreductase [Brevefilum sp.]MDT8382479.1 NAD(P)/FAD-dependent oxidoreductase [Brevefilum sp.]MDW7754843.1 NAD(P)/FAD-dependent oxidoreductase [Brevefilum sp.]